VDIKAFFDSIPHDLVERAVAHHTELAWVRLYVSRWLRAPVERPDGILMERTTRKAVSSVLSWPTCSCIMRSTCGWRGRFRPSTSSVSLTIVRHDGAKRRLPCRSDSQLDAALLHKR